MSCKFYINGDCDNPKSEVNNCSDPCSDCSFYEEMGKFEIKFKKYRRHFSIWTSSEELAKEIQKKLMNLSLKYNIKVNKKYRNE